MGRKQIEQLINDLTEAFLSSYNTFSTSDKNDLGIVDKMGFYYMGTIILTKAEDGKASIIDGQQRLTSITLLLIALSNLAKQYPGQTINFESSKDLIFTERLNIPSFTINVPEWKDCFKSLINNETYNTSDQIIKTSSRL